MATSAADRQVSLWAWIGLVLSCCFFSGITGDVPDGVVYTDLHKTVQLGDRVILKCEFLGTPLAVYWKKGNDPTIKQSLMSWFGDEPLAGTCTKDKTCDMGDDFSLIIKNISIADQNRYICRVANYKGILIYNFTDVKVFALPREPYPVISECLENHGKNCTLLSTHSVNITCTVMRYFPNIDLFFLHGVQKYATSGMLEWRNSDGTKNKAISTKAQPSEIPYVCVAFNIPGSRDQKTATVSVINNQDAPTGNNDEPHEKNATKIVLPMVFIAFGVVLAVVICLVLRKKDGMLNRRKEGDDGESQPMIQQMDVKGHLSYYELWMLVSHAKARGDRMMKLRDTFNLLQITAIKSDCARREAYHALCDWKDKQKGNQRDVLKEALEKADYTKAWEYLCELREKKGFNNPTVSPGTCKQIIWQIGNTNQISRFLSELIPGGKATIRIHDNEKIGKVAEYATDVLKDWSRSLLGVNQMVLLSTALERAGCASLGKTFFTGYLSYYELWMLVSHPHAGGDHMRKLRDTFNVLQITGIKSDFTPIDAYHALCDWKDNQERNQLDTLKEALEKADYTRAWKYIYELREKKGSNNPTVSQDTFKQIIWQIGNTNSINRFLCELIPDRSTTIDIPDTGKIGEVVKGVNDVWKDWSSRSFEVNQMVLLSIALERAGCASLGKTFFTVPSELLSVPPKEVDTFTEKLTSRHCKRLAATLKISKKQMDNIIEENYFLFDTRLMVTEWLSDMECSNYEKRGRLDDAINNIGRYDLEDFWGTVSYRRSAGAFQERPYVQSDKFDHENIYDDDIPQLVTLIEHLPPDKKKEIYNKIGYDASGEGAVKDRNRVEEKLKEWRNNILDSNSKEEALKEFQSLREDTIKGTKYDDMTLTDGEIEIVAAHVKTAKNQQTVKEKLEIEVSVRPDYSFADQLKNWRNTHKKTNCRDTLREALACIGFTECIVKRGHMKCIYQAELPQVALDLLMEDVRPIIHALGIDQARVRRYIQPTSKLDNKGTMGLIIELMKGTHRDERDRNDFCKHALTNNGFVDVGRSVYFDYVPSLSELINILLLIEDDKIFCFLGRIGLNQNDIAECQNKEGKTDMLELMILWKHQIRRVPYHYRLEIASALEASDLNEIAHDVLSGRLQTGEPHQGVLQSMCRRLDDKMLTRLNYALETGRNTRNRSTITSSVIRLGGMVDEKH